MEDNRFEALKYTELFGANSVLDTDTSVHLTLIQATFILVKEIVRQKSFRWNKMIQMSNSCLFIKCEIRFLDLFDQVETALPAPV